MKIDSNVISCKIKELEVDLENIKKAYLFSFENPEKWTEKIWNLEGKIEVLKEIIK